nr:hypothetical protein [Streptomyces aureocirculatus]
MLLPAVAYVTNVTYDTSLRRLGRVGGRELTWTFMHPGRTTTVRNSTPWEVAMSSKRRRKKKARRKNGANHGSRPQS